MTFYSMWILPPYKVTKKFMQEVIIQGVSYHHLTFDTLNRYLFDFNKGAYDAVCEKAISYYDMHATKEIKSFGN